PLFYFLEAESYIALGPYRCPVWRVAPLLDRAQQLAEEQPPDDRRKAMLDTIQQWRQMIGIGGGPVGGGPLGAVVSHLFRSGGPRGAGSENQSGSGDRSEGRDD